MLNCNECPWKHPETCKACRKEVDTSKAEEWLNPDVFRYNGKLYKFSDGQVVELTDAKNIKGIVDFINTL